MTPFDKVKTQLIVKIKEIYVPDESADANRPVVGRSA
jgi:hypothetical protein